MRSEEAFPQIFMCGSIVTEYLENTRPDLLQQLVVIAIKANPDLIRQALGVDSDSSSADAYSETLAQDQ
jgi:hypothetical protein